MARSADALKAPMPMLLDCLPCLLRQALETSRMSTGDRGAQERVMRDVLEILGRQGTSVNVLEIYGEIHAMLKAHTGASDPYKAIKERDIRMALRLYPKLRNFVYGGEDSLRRALKAAVVGNNIDSGIQDYSGLEAALESELHKSFAACDADLLEDRMKTARSLLIIGDNAGETVFDRLLIEQFPGLDVAYAVREAPVLNDATLEEARASGLEGCCARVVSSGCGTPGILPELCSPEFLELYEAADIVISKGMGNFEGLGGRGHDVFYLFMVKCPAIAERAGAAMGEYVFRHESRL
jgi:uncharacterized protein with ATP-grasp and redox domains